MPCPCKSGKGYRQCDDGKLGECVCQVAGRRQPPPANPAIRPSGDPLQAPPNVAAAPPRANRTASGLAYLMLAPGTGTTHPSPTSRVTVHYTGWTTDGKMFDSSRKRGRKATFPLNRLIAGWTEGLQLMVVGAHYRFWIPERLAYKGSPNKPQGVLVFDIELFAIQ